MKSTVVCVGWHEFCARLALYGFIQYVNIMVSIMSICRAQGVLRNAYLIKGKQYLSFFCVVQIKIFLRKIEKIACKTDISDAIRKTNPSFCFVNSCF